MRCEPDVYVVGRAIHVPGCPPSMFRGDLSDQPACAPEDAHAVLGRKGLRNRDRASRLALCAVTQAVTEAEERRGMPVSSSAAVVVGCSFGNVDTVVGVAEDIMESGDRHLSPLAAANLSSNNVSAAVSIWFRVTGPSLTLCSGDRPSDDALAAAVRILRSGRCRDVIVVGVEVASGPSCEAYLDDDMNRRLQTQASAVILSRDLGALAGPDTGAVAGGPAAPGDAGDRPAPGASAVLALVGSSGVGQRITSTQHRDWEAR